MKDLRVIFMGTPDFSVPVLTNLIEKTNVIAVVTQPDKAVGRKALLTPSPVKKKALEQGIKVFQPAKIRKEFSDIIALKPDIIITCAYGQIIPTEILDTPRLGCINVHASLLPYLRGGAPIHHAIIDGYDKTGITIMYMNEKMDEGDIIAQAEVRIEDFDTAASLHDKLSCLGSSLLMETLPSIVEGTNKRIPQDNEKATYAFNIKREDEHIDFNKTRKEIYNQVRGLNSWPGAYTVLDEKIFKVWETKIGTSNCENRENGSIVGLSKEGIIVRCADGEIILTTIQPEGKGRMSSSDYINGLKNKDEFMMKVFR